ncbi:hypothetical protein [Curtobacterium flaccumfaciens]|uniref:hypothetical protein n=1 Tax=Curtobacterium flaccumfaciens TaxID=2035 RepID=UPI001BE04EEB|nr:hypothetical protein [Curtobacterium flaccumfaciens]MBT1584424.1 hypothetical protein [Curtobacterium flaccumfaciens pv. flaccumfaciens]MCX2799694.1 hypothetical protein [Curtobacterium flaccumfaciens pv. flaccumfaciens]
MFKIGWQVFRERLPALIGPQYRRRVVVVGIIGVVVAFVGLVVLALTTDVFDATPLPSAGTVVVGLLLSVGFGCLAAACVPSGPKGWAIAPIPGIGWRTQEAVTRYHRRNPPPVDPKHRDAVLDRLPETRDLLVRSALGGLLILAGCAAALLAVVIVDVAAISAGTGLPRLPWFWFFLGITGSATGIGGLRTLGRQEQLRVEAEALPPVPPPVPPRGRPGARSGSKLALPEE